MIGMSLGHSRLDCERAANEAVRLGEMPALSGNQAKKVQSLERVGIGYKDLLVKRFRYGKIPAPLCGHALLNEVQ